MHHPHHIDAHHAHLIKSELQEVYINLIIQSFALSLITIFVPIYLVQLGYSINQALIFVMIDLGTLSFFTPFAVMLAQRFGFKHIILYRTPFVIFYFVGLYALTVINYPIYWLAVVGGIGGSMYWMSLHSLFAKHSDKLHRGRQAGKLVSLPKIAAILGPTIGGLIAFKFGFSVLFGIAIIILCISVIPLFFTGDMKPHVGKISYMHLVTRKNWRMFVEFVAQGIIFIMAVVLWPLFVYFTLKNIASVGFVATTASVGTIIFTFYIGTKSDHGSRHKMLKLGGLLLGVTFLMMIFAKQAVHIYSLAFLMGFSMILIDIPLITSFYDRANKHLAEYVILRQIGLGIGRVIGILGVLWVVNKFAVGFSMGAIASLVFSLI